MLDQILLPRNVGAVGGNDRHSKGKGVKGLPQSHQHHLEGKFAPVGPQQVAQPLRRAGQGNRTHSQNNQQQKKSRHKNFAHPLDTFLNAADNRKNHHGEKDSRINHRALPRHPRRAEHPQKITGRIRVERSGFHQIALNIFEHPSPHLRVIGQNNKSSNQAEFSDPAAPAMTDLLKRRGGIFLSSAADGKLGKHDTHSQKRDNQNINDDKGSATPLVCFAGKFPNISQPNCGTCCRQNKSETARPLRALLRSF